METPLCPQCRTPMPAQSLAGLCPACLLEQGALDTQFNTTDSSFVPPSIGELAPLFPSLEILEFIGRGGMGAVYKARQTALDRMVALKILPSAIGQDPAFSDRFSREARALAKLNHPGIVTLYEFGRAGELYFFLMEFVDGVTLRQLLLGERLSAREALAIVPRICDALQYAHDCGIVHRDIKPENILLDRQGNVKIADFGLAKLVGTEPEFTSGTGGSSAFTGIGKLMGTPAYMAPEQIGHPSSVDHRADIYALGVVLYQMLTGELPDRPLAPPSSKTLIDVRLDEVVIRALQQNPTLRFQRAGDLKTMVEEISNTPSKTPTAKRKFPVLQACGVLLILCLPLSLAIPVSLHQTSPDEKHLEESFFITPGQKSHEATLDTLKRALGHLPDVSLSTKLDKTSWRIGVSDIDRKRAEKRLNQAEAAVSDALNGSNTDPLVEKIQFNERRSTPAGVRRGYLDNDLIAQRVSCIIAGIILSTIGLLCLTLPRGPHALPVSKIPGIISLGFFILGLSGLFLVTGSLRIPYGMPSIGVTILTGIPSMVFGLSGRSGHLGKFSAALSWCGILVVLLLNFLPFRFNPDPGWTQIAVPAMADTSMPGVPTRTGNDYYAEKTKAVEAWLKLIDDAKYGEAWSKTSTLTRTLETEAGWIGRLKIVRETLGQFMTRKGVRVKWTSELPGIPKGNYFVFTFHSDFTTKKYVEETVTLIFQDDGNWRILGYSIQ